MSTETPNSKTKPLNTEPLNIQTPRAQDTHVEDIKTKFLFWSTKTKMGKRWPAIALIISLLSGLIGWQAIRRITSPALPEVTTTESTEARLPVRAVQIQESLAQAWVFEAGTALPVQLRVLNFFANGNINYMARNSGVELREGDWVSQGQLLASIDARRQTSSIDTTQADINVAISRREQSKAALLQSTANLAKAESDLSLAKTESQRYQRLFDSGAVAQSDRDLYLNRVDQAQAAFNIAQQDVNSAENDIQASQSSIAAAEARQTQASVDLEDTQLVSPIDGVVAYVNIREGEYWNTQYQDVSSPQSVIETAPIVVVDPSTYEVELEIQSEQANAIRTGQKAFVVLEEAVSTAQAGGASQADLLELAKARGSEGRVFAISPSQTPEGRGTKVTIRDFQQVRNLKVGARIYAWIETLANQDAIVVPLGAVLSREQSNYVFVVNETDGTAKKREVTLGAEGLSGVEVLSGISPGDWVVMEGQNRLVDGTPVEIVNRGGNQ
ncbi:MAG: efflux RND transporter periplasmic adaptor subunit [Phormidesmis sp.]